MFTPSKSLLFRPVPALNKLQIHQQLPLNPREARQLLNLLTTSFRQQLDSEHPRSENPSKPAAQSPISSRPRRRSFPEPWKTPDKHLHSVLTNPLFNYNQDAGLLRKYKRPTDLVDPFVLFDSAVARGMMDLNYAKVLLQAKKRDIIDSPALSVREGMRTSGAGLKVSRWLISSGATNDLEFMKDHQFLFLLLQYMVAENLQEVAWTWIKRSLKDISKLATLERNGLQWDSIRRNLAGPLLQLVKAEAEGPVSLDNAYMCLSRAAGYLPGLSTADINIALGPAGRFIAQQTLHPRSASHPSPSESSFESFLSLVPSISKETQYYMAHLSLVHPTRPSADAAIQFLRDRHSTGDKPKSLTTERNYVQLGLDTAKFLLESHKYEDADWVMHWLRTNFPGQLGVEQEREIQQAKADASSLEILEGLSLA